MFWHMDLEMILTPHGDVIKNTLLLDGEHEVHLPKIAINEDELLEYNDVKYKLEYLESVFNDGSGNHIFRYKLAPVEVPITRLILDKYIDEYMNSIRC